MSIFTKIHRGLAKFGKKMHFKDIRRIGGKVAHALHEGFHVAGKVIGAVETGAKTVGKYASKLEGIPVLGEAAAIVASGAKQVGTLAGGAKLGVKGLEKVSNKVENFVGVADRAGHRLHKSIIDGGVDSVVKEEYGNLKAANPLKK